MKYAFLFSLRLSNEFILVCCITRWNSVISTDKTNVGKYEMQLMHRHSDKPWFLANWHCKDYLKKEFHIKVLKSFRSYSILVISLKVKKSCGLLPIALYLKIVVPPQPQGILAWDDTLRCSITNPNSFYRMICYYNITLYQV